MEVYNYLFGADQTAQDYMSRITYTSSYHTSAILSVNIS